MLYTLELVCWGKKCAPVGHEEPLRSLTREVTLAGKRIFAYIITTVDSRYRLTGYVPCVEDGKVFLGPCKRLMRPDVKKGDYVLGISGSAAPGPRRVLLWMKVKDEITFMEAWRRGETDPTFRKMRGGAIHVRPRQGVDALQSPKCYEHIPGAPHEDDWENDVRGDRDVFLLGDRNSWIADESGPEVSNELVEWIKTGITWKGEATSSNPLTENARGKHVVLEGDIADRVIEWVPKLRTVLLTAKGRMRGCRTHCVCE